LSLGVKIAVIQAHERGAPYSAIKDTIAPNASVAALRKIIKRKDVYRAAAAKPGAQLRRTNLRGAAHPELDKRLYQWFCML